MKKLSSILPAAGWLAAYERGWLRPDLVAGLTTAAVVIPKAMAYATVAGLPVEVGLYTAFIPHGGLRRPGHLAAAQRQHHHHARDPAPGPSSRWSSPAAATAELLAAAATLALLVGVMLILAAVLRLGVVASFISEPVLTGFKAGIGLVIVLDQVPKLLGIHFDKGGFFREPARARSTTSPRPRSPTLAVGVAMLLILVGIERFAPRAPAPLVAVALGIAASGLLALQTHGRRDGRPDPARAAGLHAARPRRWSSSSGPARWASP